ncbi:MAG: hypothetical protein ACO3N9_10730 [Alphaproteobacteria bacterium]
MTTLESVGAAVFVGVIVALIGKRGIANVSVDRNTASTKPLVAVEKIFAPMIIFQWPLRMGQTTWPMVSVQWLQSMG